MSGFPKKIAYYITGHGFGHGVRSCALIDELTCKSEVVVQTSLPLQFFQKELKPKIKYRHLQVDVGSRQLDAVRVDIQATLFAARDFFDKSKEWIENESLYLKENKFDFILGDIPALAFAAARKAMLPSMAIGNFTWVDIYSDYITEAKGFQTLVELLRQNYLQADCYANLFPGLPARDFENVFEAGVLCRSGKTRREQIAGQFGLDSDKKWALIYIGEFGLGEMDWSRLSEFSDWEFFGLYQLPHSGSNYHQIDVGSDLSYQDCVASCDLVIGKLGYGLVTQCLTLGKPVIWLPRTDFCEFSRLKQEMLNRDQGSEISLEQLKNLQLGPFLELYKNRKFETIPSNGAFSIMEKIASLC